MTGRDHVTVALLVVVMCVVGAHAGWTNCTKACGTGWKYFTDTENTLNITCHDFACDFEASCPCGNTDLIFVMDESGSIGWDNFWIQKQFAVDIVDGTAYSDMDAAETTRISLIKFSTGVTVVFDLSSDSLASEPPTQQSIWNTPYNGGSTNTWLGLDAATAMFEDEGLENHKWIAVVITDGQSANSDLTDEAAARLQAIGASVYAIGIGSNLNIDELEAIASDPDSQFMYLVDDFNGLQNIIDQVLNGTCCDSYEQCEVLAESQVCSATCGGGYTYVYELCSSYNSYTGELLRQDWHNYTESCCTQDCPLPEPTVEDCTDCQYQAGIGYLQDPNDCHCFYTCQDYGNDNYRIYPKQCCANDLYWEEELYTCGYEVPESGCNPEGIDTCLGFTPVSTITTTRASTTKEPCPYHQDPENPQNFLDSDNNLVGTCPDGTIWDNDKCSCVFSEPPDCTSGPLLFYPFDTSLDDESCTGAISDVYPVVVVAPNGVGGNCSYFNSGFLSVPYLSGHFANVDIENWSVIQWYYRTHDFVNETGLVNNGDCNDDPAFALYIDKDEMLIASITTTNGKQTNTADVSEYRNVWVNVAMTYDGAYLRIYVNGVEANTGQPLTGPIIDNGHCNMKIGQLYDADHPTGGFFYGYMDDLYVYQETLTSGEINDMYNNPVYRRK